MKVVIIEDEALVARDLKKLLLKIDPDLEVQAILESVEDARNYFKSSATPELIFSDIQLADGVSFEIFNDNAPDCPIIFTTAYDEYAIKAFKLNSVDYLLKPLEEEDLKNALEKFKKYRDTSGFNYKDQFSELLKDLKGEGRKKYKTRFTGHLAKSIVAVHEDNVAYFMKDVLIFLVTTDNTQIVTDYNSLEELEELVDPSKFIRANRQFIVHLNAIDKIHPHHTGKLQLELKQPLKAEVTVSREKAGEFKKWFEGD